MTPSRNTRSYTLRSVPSSPGRSFLHFCLLSDLHELLWVALLRLKKIGRLLWPAVAHWLGEHLKKLLPIEMKWRRRKMVDLENNLIEHIYKCHKHDQDKKWVWNWFLVPLISQILIDFPWRHHVSSPSGPIGQCLISENPQQQSIGLGPAHFQSVSNYDPSAIPCMLLIYHMIVVCCRVGSNSKKNIVGKEAFPKKSECTWSAIEALVGGNAKCISPNFSSFKDFVQMDTWPTPLSSFHNGLLMKVWEHYFGT